MSGTTAFALCVKKALHDELIYQYTPVMKGERDF
jgi:hypothetical protein